MADDSPILVEYASGVQTITINRPERGNALNEEVMELIGQAIRQANASEEVRAIVLTGAGDRAFCAGGELRHSKPGSLFSIEPSRPNHGMVELLKVFHACDLPLIARVNGHALAGGLGLVCGCDLAVTVDTARFGAPEVKRGLFPITIMPYLLRVVPPRKLMEMSMTGEPINADEAKELGIVNYVVPAAELDTKTEWLVDQITRQSPTGIRLGKRAFHTLQDLPLPAALALAEASLPGMVLSEDAREGFAAFQEKRAPNWPGR